MTTFLNFDSIKNDEDFNKQENVNKINLEKFNNKTDQELRKFFLDGSNSIVERIYAVTSITEEDFKTSCIYDVLSMFDFSPTSIMRQLIYSMIKSNEIDVFSRIKCCQSLYDDNKAKSYLYFIFVVEDLIKQNHSIVGTLDLVRTLMEIEKLDEEIKDNVSFYDKTLGFLKHIVSRSDIEADWRYKIIVDIERNKKTRPFIQRYIDDLLFFIVQSSTALNTRHRISASQLLLSTKTTSDDIRDIVEKIIISFATDTELDYNLRADASDLLIGSGSVSAQNIGRDIILTLGGSKYKKLNLYDDRQNIHTSKINESILKFIQKLSRVSVCIATFEEIAEEVIKFATEIDFKSKEDLNIEVTKNEKTKNISDIDRIKSSLYRISIDGTIYCESQTLQGIFCRIWNIIITNENSFDLKKRLLEELTEMSDTCSTGHLFRLVNVLSGFEIDGNVFNIDIGYENQIQSNIYSEINRRIQNLEDEEYGSLILDEITTSENTPKPNLRTFIIKNLQSIKDKMWDEFKTLVSEWEFEEFFQKSIFSFIGSG